MIVYKIYDPRTGLYKNRGFSGGWSKKGSAWNGIGQLKNHLRLGIDLRGSMFNLKDAPPYAFEPHWEVHEFEVIERSKGHSKITEFLRDHPNKP